MDAFLQIDLLIIRTKKLTSLTKNIFVRGHLTLTHLQTTGVEIIIGFALRYRLSVLC